MRFNRSLALKLAGVFFSLLVMELFFFREMLLPFKDRLIGDTGDSRFNNFLLEHWFHVFQGRESVRDLIILYPLPATLGYSDMMFGFSLPYSLLRLFGVNLFLANKLTLMGIHFFGSICQVYFLCRKMAFGMVAGVIGTAFWAYASAYNLKLAHHTQLLFFSAVPLLAIFLHSFWAAQENKKRRIFYGVLSIIWLALLFSTSFYVGFFSGLFLMTLTGVYLVWQGIRGNNILACLGSWGWKNAGEVLLYLATGILSMVPFFWVYLPVLRRYGARSWEETLLMLPNWFDYVNSSPYSLLWGNLLLAWIPDLTTKPYPTELWIGFPFFTAILLAGSLFYGARYASGLLFVLTVSVLVSIPLLVKTDGGSLWWFVYQYVPGAGAVRVASRYLIFLALPASIVVAWFIHRFVVPKQAGPGKQWMTAGLLLLLLLLDNTVQYKELPDWRIWRVSDMNKIIPADPPPQDCRVMYLIGTESKSAAYFSPLQLHSWMIADHYGLKTLNGHPGQPPPGWDLSPIDSPDYEFRVRRWVVNHDLQNVCSYNLVKREWKEFRLIDGAAVYTLGERIVFSSEAAKNGQMYLLSGWSNMEAWGCWSDGAKARVLLSVGKNRGNLVLRFSANAYTDEKGLQVEIVANGKKFAQMTLNPVGKEYVGRFPADLIGNDGLLLLTFQIQNPSSPKMKGQSEDTRLLGMGLRWLELNAE